MSSRSVIKSNTVRNELEKYRRLGADLELGTCAVASAGKEGGFPSTYVKRRAKMIGNRNV